MIKFVRMLNYGASNINIILNVGKPMKNMKRVGYTSDSSTSKNMFVILHILSYIITNILTPQSGLLSIDLFGFIIIMVEVVTFFLYAKDYGKNLHQN